MTIVANKCPFCGHADVYINELARGEFIVECNGCYSGGPICGDVMDAIAAWNKAVRNDGAPMTTTERPTATMKSSIQETLPVIGTAMGAGFYAGRILIDGDPFALIVAPKADGEHKPTIWIPNYKDVPGAKSYNDGLANTQAMAEAGSNLAKWALGLEIGGANDWYLPAQDELEIIYRNLKPTTDKNSCWGRSGINLSAFEPTRPYTPDFPPQTPAEAFQQGGAEAFTADRHWSSTQPASHSDYAWSQSFARGTQEYYLTDHKLRARAVRRLPI